MAVRRRAARGRAGFLAPTLTWQPLFDFHKVWGYVAIVANAVVGVLALIAWRVGAARGRWLWIVTIIAER